MNISVLEDIKSLPAYHELIVNFTLREIKAKYKQAFLGVTWAIIQPVVLLAMMTLVFSYFARIPSDGIPYPLFLFAALLPWQFFGGALNRGTGSLVNQAALITKIYFPRESLVLASLAAALVDFGITASVFVALLVYYHVAPAAMWLWAVPVFAIQLTLTLGMMLFLAPLNAMYRDVGQAIPLAIQIWMYATPIMYPASLVPASVRGYYFLNPMAVIVEAYRSAILRNAMPDLVSLTYVLVVAVIVLVCGYRLFKHLEKRIADVA
jgi:homopolymeric O-antigen transport system permease protein